MAKKLPVARQRLSQAAFRLTIIPFAVYSG
jgi:hypothetical protein